MQNYRVTLWFEEDGLIVSFVHPLSASLVEFDTTDVDRHDGAIGILEDMTQSDAWAGIFFAHKNVTRVTVEKEFVGSLWQVIAY